MIAQTGRFIVFEGGEGAGKSTQIQIVAKYLRSRGRSVLCTREPGGSPLAEAIRKLVLEDWSEGMDAHTELLLIFAARAAHLHSVIRPALADGVVVLCDRFIDATYAYQGAGRGIDSSLIRQLQDMVIGELHADQVIVLDVPANVGLDRTRRRGFENRFEAEEMEFQERVRQAYLARARAWPQRYALIDATQNKEQVTAQLLQVLGEME